MSNAGFLQSSLRQIAKVAARLDLTIVDEPEGQGPWQLDDNQGHNEGNTVIDDIACEVQRPDVVEDVPGHGDHQIELVERDDGVSGLHHDDRDQLEEKREKIKSVSRKGLVLRVSIRMITDDYHAIGDESAER